MPAEFSFVTYDGEYMIRYSIPIVVFISILAILMYGLGGDPTFVPSPLINKLAPVFDLPRVENSEFLYSNKDLEGEVYIVNFWASWCITCHAEHPLLFELAKVTNSKIVGVNYKDSQENAVSWLNKYGDPYYVKVADMLGQVGIDYGVYLIPQSFIVDSNGIIRYKQTGPFTENTIINTIQPLINQLKMAN